MAKIDDAKMVWDAAMSRLKLNGKNAVHCGETVRELLLPGASDRFVGDTRFGHASILDQAARPWNAWTEGALG